MNKSYSFFTSTVLLAGVALFFASCSHNNVKLNKPVTTKKGLEITVTGISEKKAIGSPEDKTNYTEAKNGNLFIVLEYQVSNPTSAQVEEMATAGLMGPDKKLPDESLTASVAFERTDDKYKDNYAPENGRTYAAGKARKVAAVYEMPESEWKASGWKMRILGDKGFQVFGDIKAN